MSLMPGRGAEQVARELVAVLRFRRRAGRDANQQERLLDRRDLVLRSVGQDRDALATRAHDAEFGEIADLVGQHRELLALGYLLADRERLERVTHDRVRDGGAASPRPSAPRRST